MRKKRVGLRIGIVILIAGAGVMMYTMYRKNQVEWKDYKLVILDTDRAMYSPEERCVIRYQVSSMAKERKETSIVLKVMHLEQVIAEIPVQTVWLTGGEVKTLEAQWTVPVQDFTGYLLELGFADHKGALHGSDTIGIDVSSDWVKFPRYGYLCDFGKEVDAGSKIAQMNRYHINGIEYYDWHYLHHQPLAYGITAQEPGSWKDWSGREISGETIADYIEKAKESNMVNMAYNMIYAGTDTFFKDQNGRDTKANAWKLYFAKENDRGKGDFTFHMGISPSGNGNLYFLNPLNKEWQRHIFSEELKVFSAFLFDGWHGDTVGDWGEMVTASGEPLGYQEDGTPIYQVTDTYTQFLNAAKEALGEKYLSFNPVGAQGIENANVSRTDVLYTEFWPWDKDREGKPYDTYASLVREIEQSMEDSKAVSFDKKGKSLAVKAYINYYKTNGYMNAPGVLLADAAVYAAGGSRLELGNGDRMLHVEYYPDDGILMEEALKEQMKRVYDFVVAYENLLRDGQWTTDNPVHIEGYAYGKEGASDTIWTYTRADSEYEILHLINLLGTDNEWRDERGKKAAPIEAHDLKITYYTDRV